jgi:hypothetical protein
MIAFRGAACDELLLRYCGSTGGGRREQAWKAVHPAIHQSLNQIRTQGGEPEGRIRRDIYYHEPQIRERQPLFRVSWSSPHILRAVPGRSTPLTGRLHPCAGFIKVHKGS